MSITLNAKGTSVPSFTIGKGGVTIYQGLSDPYPTYTLKDGDYWLDKTTNALKVWSTVGPAWQAPRLADLHFVNNSIVATGGQDLTLSVDVNHSVNIDAGNSGPALITATNSQDLHINPATGGGQYLVLNVNRWPTADGTANQVLTTNGAGVLSFTTLNIIGSPAPATNATTGFAYIPVTTGTPTETPTAITGYTPMMTDSSGSKLWVYIGGSWKYTILS
jgi:hypothetical protein